MINLKETLFKLSKTDAAALQAPAADLAYEMLSSVCETQKTSTLDVTGFLKGESDYTLMLDAHIDQISMVVTDIDNDGFLTVAKAGGFDLRALPSRRVTVHGKEKITAVFCSTPPHLSQGDIEFKDIADLKLDTCLGEDAKKLISVGDIVTFCTEPEELSGSVVTGKSFDDRAAVACVIELARRLSREKLPFNVVFALSDGEELGMRGARPLTFKVNPDEAIAIDVSFGDGVGISEDECGKLGGGGMIGIAPLLDKKISDTLKNLAIDKNIPYQLEVMGRSTGTNADVISLSREGVRTGLLSIPLRNMHTDSEIVDLKDLKAVTDLLYEYVLSGGVKNA